MKEFEVFIDTMFSTEGNKVVEDMVKSIEVESIGDDEGFYGLLDSKMTEVAKTHEEVWDTAVREDIIWNLEKIAGLDGELTIYW